MKTHNGLFNSLDRRIQAFSALPGNEALLARTGSYSTLMRGSVLGKYRRDEAEIALEADRLDVLMLGSNPNAGPHQTAAVKAEYGTLADQIETGMVGEQKWDSRRRARPGWDFLVESNEGWKYFRSLLRDITSLDRIGMCNLIPWGSKDVPELCRAVDGHVLRDALRFAGELNASLVRALCPRVIIVPTSLTSNGDLNRLHRSAYAEDAEKVAKNTVRMSSKNFYFRVGKISFDDFTAAVIHMAHPASFVRIGEADRELVRSAITAQMKQALANV